MPKPSDLRFDHIFEDGDSSQDQDVEGEPEAEQGPEGLSFPVRSISSCSFSSGQVTPRCRRSNMGSPANLRSPYGHSPASILDESASVRPRSMSLGASEVGDCFDDEEYREKILEWHQDRARMGDHEAPSTLERRSRAAAALRRSTGPVLGGAMSLLLAGITLSAVSPVHLIEVATASFLASLLVPLCSLVVLPTLALAGLGPTQAWNTRVAYIWVQNHWPGAELLREHGIGTVSQRGSIYKS